MPITVRYAKKGDEGAIAALLVAIHAQHAEGRPDLFGAGRAKYDEAAVLAMLEKENAPILVAVEDNENGEDGEVLGYAVCQVVRNENPAQSDYQTLYIDDINVAASARRKGVGSALLEKCRKLAVEKACYNLTLNVWAFNTGAIAFYEANGFSTQRMILEEIL